MRGSRMPDMLGGMPTLGIQCLPAEGIAWSVCDPRPGRYLAYRRCECTSRFHEIQGDTVSYTGARRACQFSV